MSELSHDPVLILIPVLKRPHRVAPVVASIRDTTPPPYRILFLCTDEDTTQIAAVQQSNCDYLLCGPRLPGDYARKINRGYRESTEPLLFLGADDLIFYPDWLPNAIHHLSNRIQVVGTNDLGNPRVQAGRHSTHTLLTRAYADNHGTIDQKHRILHELYDHTFCDDEFVHTAIARGMFAHAHDSIVEHLHPNWGKGEMDEVYQIAEDSLRSGRQLFNSRRLLWRRLPYARQVSRTTSSHPRHPNNVR